MQHVQSTCTYYKNYYDSWKKYNWVQFALTFMLILAVVGCDKVNNAPTSSLATNQTPTTAVKASRTSQLSTAQPTRQTSSRFQEGVHYLTVGTPTTNAQGKTVVTEVFWYGCPHCYSVLPMLQSWEQNLPVDVEVVLLPAPLSGLWSLQAQIFYTNQALGIVDATHKATFDAIHLHGNRLSSLASAQDFYYKNFDVDKDTYAKVFKSFAVDVALSNAKKSIETWQINSVPTFVVAGAYVVNTQTAGSNAKIFDVIDYLLANKI